MKRFSKLTLMFVAMVSFARADDPQFLSRARQLTFEGKRSGEGYFSPDGKRIIFQSEREAENPFYQIYILDLTSGDTHRVSSGVGKTTCSFFRPGTQKVLFASTHLDPQSVELQKQEIENRASGKQKRYAWDYDEHYDIFEANQDGTELKRLTDAVGYDAEGDYSPDGTKIVFSSNRSAYPLSALSPEDRQHVEMDPSYFSEIYIMNADGSNQTRLTDMPGYDGGPFFSPDGKRIIWRRFEVDGTKADVYKMNLDGSDERRITDFGAMSWAPYFHPSGDYLIFASNKLGFDNFELYMTDAKGEKEPVRVTFTDGFDGLPVFSPDGRQLCWTSSRAGGKAGQLFIGQWNDAAARKALSEAPARGKHAEKEVGSAPPTEPKKAEEKVGEISKHSFSSEITEDDLKTEIGYLASDELEGRLTGSKGEELAADFIEARFKKIGLVPIKKNEGFRQGFSFTSGVHAGPKNELSLSKVDPNPHVALEDRAKSAEELKKFEHAKSFSPLAFSDSGTTQGLLAFVGYGLVVPGENGEKVYDSYEKADVKGRIVIALRYVPENVPSEKRQVLLRYAGIRYKALQAREHGAAGMLIVTGPNSPEPGKLIPIAFDMGGASSGILAASIDVETANQLLAQTGKNLKDLQTELDAGEKKDGIPIDERMAKLSVELEKETSTGHNVIGVLPPSDGINSDTEYIVVGAHYDHLGHGGAGTSLAHKGEEGQIHHGADDNASGATATLEIAEEIASKKIERKRGVIFAAWSGEEIGLLGSAAFCEKAPIDLTRIVADLNMDMVGRLKENKLTVQGVGSSKDWRGMIEKRNVAAGFSLALADDPYLPTDSTSFYQKKIPTLNFFTGAHEDYHRPTDTADKINYADLARISQFVEAIAVDVTTRGERPAYAKVEQSATPAGGRDALRIYLGTIPDYSSEDVKGVKLAGVREGGPADKGGLKGGDVIVEFGGQKITNIYDYTYALDAAKMGQPLKIKVMREGKPVDLTVIPEAHK